MSTAAERGHDSSERRSRRRQWLFGCGTLVVLFAGAFAFLMRDEPPPDVSDLLPPETAPVPEGESCEAALLALHEARGELPDWEEDFELLREPDPWGGAPLDRGVWARPELIEAMDARFLDEEVSLDSIDAALALPHGGWTVPEDFTSETPVMEIRTLARELDWRALWLRLRGESDAAALDAERVLRLGDRMLLEGGNSLLQVIVAAAIVDQGWTMVHTLVQEGELDAASVDRLIARESSSEAEPNPFARAMRYEFRNGANIFGAIGDGEVNLQLFMVDAPVAGHWFKRNRSVRRLADFYREAMHRTQQEPFDRALPSGKFGEDGSWERAILSLNSGELLLPDLQLGLDGVVSRSDRLHVLDELSRWRLALSRYERTHGALPATLEELAAAAPELDAVPTDPFSGQPYRYDPVRRLIWSVGENRTDENAADAASLTEPEIEWYELPDWIFHVPE